MIRRFSALLAAAVVAVLLPSCESVGATDPALGVRVTVDSTVYHLKPQPSNYWYEIDLTVTVVNDNAYEVFLSQNCPSWQLIRADETDKTDLFLGAYGCALIGLGLEKPRILAPGERFSQSFRLTGSNSPNTRPPITIENNTGTLVFTYGLTDPDGKPIGRASSGPFRVEPPA